MLIQYMALNGTSRSNVGHTPRNNESAPSWRTIRRKSDIIPLPPLAPSSAAPNPDRADCCVLNNSKGAVDSDATNRADAPAKAGTASPTG
mmetsp:Transcript_16969/g.35020  ORF Transcript_16969/g.35020 Transcript_16969/m.35020 type:complete len:90 (+) Transcript_16969:668-937(+)